MIFILMFSLMLLFSGCSNDKTSVPPIEETPLIGTIAKKNLIEVTSLVRCDCLRNGIFVILNSNPPQLSIYNLATDETTILGAAGEGPGEIESRMNFMSVIGDSIFLHKMNRLDTNLYENAEFLHTIHHDIPLLSAALVGKFVVAELYVGANKEVAEIFGNKYLLGVFKAEKDDDGRHIWKLEHRFLDAIYTPYPHVDYPLNFFWHVESRDDSTFYRIPLWGRKYVEVYDVSGRMLLQIPIPTNKAKSISDDPQQLASIEPTDLVVLKDGKSDNRGWLHLLSEEEYPLGRENNSRDVIFTFNKKGELKNQFYLDRRIVCLAVLDGGFVFLGIDSESGDLVEFATEKQR